MVECKNAISQPSFVQIVFPNQFWAQILLPFPVLCCDSGSPSDTNLIIQFCPSVSFNLAIELNFNLHRKCIVFFSYATGGLFDLVITYFYHSLFKRRCHGKTVSSSIEAIECEHFTNPLFNFVSTNSDVLAVVYLNR